MKTQKFIKMTLVVCATLFISSCMTQKRIQRILDANRVNNLQQTEEQSIAKPINQVTPKGIPCFKEALDNEQYLTGFGTNTNMDFNTAYNNAKNSAITSLLSKYVGAYKSGLISYSKDSQVPSGQKQSMAKIEGGVISACQNAVNGFIDEICHEAGDDRLNGQTAYVTVRISKERIKREVADAIESMGVDVNANRFFELVNQQLNDQKVSAANDSTNTNKH